MGEPPPFYAELNDEYGVSLKRYCILYRTRQTILFYSGSGMSGYTVLKTAGTHSDVLAAFGLADLLQHLDPRLVDLGDRIEVRLRRRLLPSDLAAAVPGFSYLEKAKESGSVRVVKKTRRPRIVSVSVSENRMYTILGRMNAQRGPNLVVARYAKMGRAQWAQKVWECLHGRPGFVFTSPLVQLFNPHAARGSLGKASPISARIGRRTTSGWFWMALGAGEEPDFREKMQSLGTMMPAKQQLSGTGKC